MGLAQQAALVGLAAAEGRALEGGLASPALVLAVKVLLQSSCPTFFSSACNMHLVTILHEFKFVLMQQVYLTAYALDNIHARPILACAPKSSCAHV